MATHVYKTLVLPGNGSKGIYTLGILQHLYHVGMLTDIDNFIGTSSGAVISLLLAAGYTPIEILAHITSQHLYARVGKISLLKIMNGNGIFSFDQLGHELCRLLLKMLGCIPTIAQFAQLTGTNWAAVGYNATQHKRVYFTAHTHPNMSVVTAVQISTAYPLVFDAVIYNNRLFVDGGVADNFPIEWAIQHLPGEILGVYVRNHLTPIIDTTSKFSMVHQILNIVINRPDVSAIARFRDVAKIIDVTIGANPFFDFSVSNLQLIRNFDEGGQKCKEAIT